MGLRLTKPELRKYIVECLKEKDNLLSRDIRDMIEEKTGVKLTTGKIAQALVNMSGMIESEKEIIRASSYRKRHKLVANYFSN